MEDKTKYSLEETKEREQEYPLIKMRFPKSMAYRIYDEFESSLIEVLENGDYIVSAHMPIDSWLIGFLLSFGSMVEVISPVSIKEILKKEAKKIYEMNQS